MGIEEARNLLPGLEAAVWVVIGSGVYDGPTYDAIIAARDEAAQVVVADFWASRLVS